MCQTSTQASRSALTASVLRCVGGAELACGPEDEAAGGRVLYPQSAKSGRVGENKSLPSTSVDQTLCALIEQHMLRYVATPSRQFPRLRASGEVDLSLLRLGARSHPNPATRWRCLTLLDHLDGDDSVPVFIEALLGDPVPRVRRHALHALSCERCKAEPICADVVPAIAMCAQNDDNVKVRQQARELLIRYR